MDKVAAKIQFEKYIIRNINFQLNPTYKPDPNGDEVEIDIALDHRLSLDPEGNKAELVLVCELSKDFAERNRPFGLTVEIVGFFDYDITLDTEQKTRMLIMNGSAILFPYLRTVISMITLLSGIPSFVLPTINIAKLVKEADSSSSD